MKKRIIFLDIDGPLCYGSNYDELSQSIYITKDISIERGFHDEAIEALNKICEHFSDVYIVISSDWRLAYTLDELHIIFNHFGFKYINRIIDITDNKNISIIWHLEYNRAFQISNYIKKHTISKWVAIDDLNMSYYFTNYLQLPNNFVKIDGDIRNFLSNNINKIISILE